MLLGKLLQHTTIINLWVLFCRRPVDSDNDQERIACMITSTGSISIDNFQEQINSGITYLNLIPMQEILISGNEAFVYYVCSWFLWFLL